jgi:hypothetical protein
VRPPGVATIFEGKVFCVGNALEVSANQNIFDRDSIREMPALSVFAASP